MFLTRLTKLMPIFYFNTVATAQPPECRTVLKGTQTPNGVIHDYIIPNEQCSGNAPILPEPLCSSPNLVDGVQVIACDWTAKPDLAICNLRWSNVTIVRQMQCNRVAMVQVFMFCRDPIIERLAHDEYPTALRPLDGTINDFGVYYTEEESYTIPSGNCWAEIILNKMECATPYTKTASMVSVCDLKQPIISADETWDTVTVKRQSKDNSTCDGAVNVEVILHCVLE